MKLSRFFKKKSSKEDQNERDEAVRKPVAEESAPPGKKQAEETSAASPAPEPTKPDEAVQSDEESGSADMDHIASMFGSIQSVLGEEEEELAAEETEGEIISVPCSALLKNVPEQMQGPEYDPDNFPSLEIPLDRDKALQQLKTGRVTVALDRVLPLLPSGWIVNGEDQEVNVDLPSVVAAIPPEMIGGAKEESQSFRDLRSTSDLFKAKTETATTAEQPQPTPEPQAAPEAPVAEPERAPEPQPEVSKAPAAEPEAAVSSPEAAEEAETPRPAAVEAPVPQPPAEIPAPPPAPEAPVEEEAIIPEPPSPAPPTEAARPVKPQPVGTPAASTTEPVGWRGVETSLASGAGVDINTASVEDLVSLPGVGATRAQQIIDFRRKHGPFKDIYGLMKMPGIGAGLFRQMTGLSPSSGRARHETLNSLLNLPAGKEASLQQIARAFAEEVGAEGCILSTDDGIPLAATKDVQEDADRYAAINTQLFHRTSKYLHGITGSDVECISLPVASPPLILFTINSIYLVLVQGDRLVTLRDFRKATSVAREIGWLLGPRAVVREL